MLRPNHTILDLKTLTDVDYFLPVLDAWSLGVAVVSLIVTAAAALFTLVTVGGHTLRMTAIFRPFLTHFPPLNAK